MAKLRQTREAKKIDVYEESDMVKSEEEDVVFVEADIELILVNVCKMYGLNLKKLSVIKRVFTDNPM